MLNLDFVSLRFGDGWLSYDDRFLFIHNDSSMRRRHKKVKRCAVPCLKISVIAILFIIYFSSFPSHCRGDTTKYFYDQSGRIDRVVTDSSGEIYSYDKLGNLMSVQLEPTSASAPVITSASPDVVFIGEGCLVKLIGDNLLPTESVASGNPDLSIKVVSVSDSEILAEMTAVAVGTATVTVTNSYGQDSTDITMSDATLSFSPERLLLKPGDSGPITVNINQPLASELTINLANSFPEFASLPESVTIPIVGETNFTASALEVGTSEVSAGNAKSLIVVDEPLTGEFPNLSSQPVSVRIEPPQQIIAPVISNGISIRVEPPQQIIAPVLSNPISVSMEISQYVPGITVSKLVSVAIQ